MKYIPPGSELVRAEVNLEGVEFVFRKVSKRTGRYTDLEDSRRMWRVGIDGKIMVKERVAR